MRLFPFWRRLVLCVFAALLMPAIGDAQTGDGDRRAERREQRGDKPKRQPQWVLPADVAPLDLVSVVLGRPTDRSVTASVVARSAGEAFIEFGDKPGNYVRKTDMISLRPDVPGHMQIDRLMPDSRIYYRLRYRAAGQTAFAAGTDQSFQTQRPPGSRFVFEVQGDSHPERRQQFAPELYAKTLRGVAADHPDFYLLMGDDFSIDTLPVVNQETVTQRYQLQRPFLSLVGSSAPLFLVNGNHEQAARANLDGTADNVAVWAQNARNAYYPQPAPDGFYTGDTEQVPHIGLLRDYYAWTWGDALFVVLDPYWHSEKPVDNAYGGGKKNRDLWDVTLGDAQYRWLKQTLESSKSRFKFVFAHHVHGTTRGGIEQTSYYEWGGRGRNGSDEFRQRRPGWEMPIHHLIVKHGVTIFFQGHDHVFARQELDGVIYQTLPEPADPNYALYFQDTYRSGDLWPNSGRVRVSVSPEKLQVEYIKSRLPADVSPAHPDGEVAFAYEVQAAGSRFRTNGR